MISSLDGTVHFIFASSGNAGWNYAPEKRGGVVSGVGADWGGCGGGGEQPLHTSIKQINLPLVLICGIGMIGPCWPQASQLGSYP